MSTTLESALAAVYPDRKAQADATDPPPPIPAWVRMTEAERFNTLQAMQRFGGAFVSALGAAWLRADSTNAARLGCTFADYVRAYGPGTTPYAAARGEA